MYGNQFSSLESGINVWSPYTPFLILVLFKLFIFMGKSAILLLLTFLTFDIPATVGQTEIIGQGQTSGITITSSSGSEQAINTIESSNFLPNYCNASRFLSNSTFGASFEDIESLTQTGFNHWLTEQFNKPQGTKLTTYVEEYYKTKQDSTGNPNTGASQKLFDFAWWQYHMSNEDFLRQRVAFALSEIFVTSRISSFTNDAFALSSYYDLLLDNAFGNYRTLIEEITYHPTMGVYLTYMNNPKTDTSLNRFPDENYAREIMQLFSIGLYNLNNDGSIVLDSEGEYEASYSNIEIVEFAKVFTGLMWGDRDPIPSQFFKNKKTYKSYTYDMQMLNDMHEPGEKYLLNDFVVPNRDPVDGDADIQDALDNIYNHQNVGPFLAKRLIQRLVTSNPSASFIDKIANVFNDNGDGVRGDLKAVVTAILTSPEATDCDGNGDPNFGKMREPFIRYMQLARAFNWSTPSGTHRNEMRDVFTRVNQRPLNAITVFNFFRPDFQPIGEIADANLEAPEFQITYSFSILDYMNGVNEWIVDDDYADVTKIYGGETIPDDIRGDFDLADEIDLADDDHLVALIDRLNLLLANGNISQEVTEMIVDDLKKYPAEDNDDLELRARIAIYFAMVAPDFIIND